MPGKEVRAGSGGEKTKGIDFIKWFYELSNKDIKIAGGKGASLAEMFNSKFPVPPGFIITAQAYKCFIEKAGLVDSIHKLFSGLDIEDTELLEKNASEIRELVSNAEMPKEMEDEISEAYEMLNADKDDFVAKGRALDILRTGKEPPFVAVRSSATAEDLADASFAGQQESFLNVKGKSNLIQKVKECFASLFTARAVYYRTKKGFSHETTYLAVVVQRMIDSDKSGVIFSENPVKNDGTIMIEAVFGLGEGIVSGMIKPDSYIVSGNLDKFDILEMAVAEKKVAITRNSSGKNEIVKLTREKAAKQVLTSYEIKVLAQYAKKLEEHYKKPQDIEFAIESGEIYIVQSRPITTLSKIKSINEADKISGKVILSGLGASPGVASGVVKIIKDLRDLSKIRSGDVLVTIMTNPDMVVTMQKSAAIVTDEGGITCFSGDTRVLTNRGFTSIKDTTELVNSGEEIILLAYDSKNMKPVWKRIISAAGRKRDCIRISVSQTGKIEDNYLDLTPDHKMITFEGRDLIKEQIGSLINKEKHLCLIDALPNSEKISNPKLAYLLGALFSDGNIALHKYAPTGNFRRGRITFTQKETPQKEEFINTVREYFEECFGDKFKEGRLKYAYGNLRGRIVQGFANDYICNNLEVAKTITKISQNLDRFILGIDQQSCLNFLAGLIDGDGCFYQNRLHIYADKENVLQGVILACLNLGIFPQITRNRNIHHIQILERLNDILRCAKRVKGIVTNKTNGNKLLSAKQVLGDIIDEVNYKGRTKAYVNNNLLIDADKVARNIIPIAREEIKEKLAKILNSGLRMQRTKKICDIGEIDVYNLEIEANNELDHNFIVFTKKYTPLLVSNSHAAIISREMGIPAVVGTGEATEKLKDGMIISVDGSSGKVFEGAIEGRTSEVNPVVETKTKIKVLVDLPDYAERAALSKCEGVGLTRLEGIIASSGKHPLMFVKHGKTEEYIKILYDGLKKISSFFKEIWIRTSDIRSDEYKNLEGAPKEVEGNPMLGDHGIRFSLKHIGIIESEIKAIKKLALEFEEKQFGIMMPQIISVKEVEQTKEVMSKIEMPDNVKLGIMVETPAAVQIINDLCEAGIKFISFGTNDLTQYTLAIDRNNSEVQNIYDEMNPAVLNSISYVIRRCRKYKVETSICGQAGSKEEMVKFLVREGIDSISVNADAAEKISRLVAGLEKELKLEKRSGVPIEIKESALFPDGANGRSLPVGAEQEAFIGPRLKQDNLYEKDIEEIILDELDGSKQEQAAKEIKEAVYTPNFEQIFEPIGNGGAAVMEQDIKEMFKDFSGDAERAGMLNDFKGELVSEIGDKNKENDENKVLDETTEIF